MIDHTPGWLPTGCRNGLEKPASAGFFMGVRKVCQMSTTSRSVSRARFNTSRLIDPMATRSAGGT